MDNSLTTCDNLFSFDSGVGNNETALGLCVHQHDMGVPLTAHFSGGSNAVASTQVPDQCRSALEWILTSVDAARAAVWADRLIHSFGSLANTLGADSYLITEVLNGCPAPAVHLNKFHLIMSHASRCRLRYGSILSNWPELIKYLTLQMGQLKIEQVRVVLFDKAWNFMGEEIIASGNISEASCYPRQVARKAVIFNAAGLVLVHNHPTGNPEMSRDDKAITLSVQEACSAVGVKMHDHLVICRDRYSSYRENNPLWARTN